MVEIGSDSFFAQLQDGILPELGFEGTSAPEHVKAECRLLVPFLKSNVLLRPGFHSEHGWFIAAAVWSPYGPSGAIVVRIDGYVWFDSKTLRDWVIWQKTVNPESKS